MKRFVLLSTIICLSGFLLAQVPQAIQYQAVIRDAQGNPLASQSIRLRISVLTDSLTGLSAYTETHQVTTSSLGLVHLAIGQGSVVSGQFSAIHWGSGPHYARVELDMALNGNYTLLATTQLLSVPYALYAGSSAVVVMSTAERDAFPNPTPGMQILNSDNFCLNVYTGNAWIAYCGTCTPQPDPAQAGPDMLNVTGTSVILQGNQPVFGNGSWSLISGNGGQIAVNSQSNSSFTGHPGAFYTLVWTISNSCGSSSDTVNISFACDPQYIPADAGNDVAICPGGCTQLTASGGVSYLWSTQQQQAGIQVCPSQTTTYHVTVTDDYGCTAAASVTVTVNPFPNASAGQDVSICLGECTQLQASGGASYLWSTQEATAVIEVCPAQTTTYAVTVTDAQGCVATDEVVVTVLPLPAANAGQDVSICAGECTQLQASGGVTYLWSTQATTAAIEVCPAQTTTYGVTVTDAQGCTASDEVTVSVHALPVADAGQDTAICPGDCAQLLAGGGTTYLWSTQETTAGIQVCPSASTTYSVTVTDLHGCSATDTVRVEMLPLPDQAQAGADNLNIVGTTTSLQANIPVNGSGLWTIISGQGGSFADATLATSLFTGQVGQSYTLVWSISTVCNYTSDTVLISFEMSNTALPCPGMEVIEYDGRSYHTVLIGTQCWMRENLNVGVAVNSVHTLSSHTDVSNNGIIEKYCYDNDTSNCAAYGGLYDWNEAMGYSTTPGVQGICPPGWRIPTDADWCTLSLALDSTVDCNVWTWSGFNIGGKLKETGLNHWLMPNSGATNESGFTARGGGQRYYTGSFNDLNVYAYFWSSTEFSSLNGISRFLTYDTNRIGRSNGRKVRGFSVRCMRNMTTPQPPSQPSPINGPVSPCELETGLIYQVNEEAGVTYTWSVPSDWNISGGQGTHQITVTAGNTAGNIEVIPANSFGSGTSQIMAVSPVFCCGATPVTFMYNGSMVTYGTVSRSGLCWLDRNLGASRVATSSTDAQAYGDMFQWGRGDDGHQLRTSATTTVLSNSDIPGHSDFIRGSASTADWRSPQNESLWQGIAGINNPCPAGFRIPTESELNNERLSWSANNSSGAFGSTLRWTNCGFRRHSDGLLLNVSTGATVWSSTIISTGARNLSFSTSNGGMGSNGRAAGMAVRCVRAL